MFFPKLIPMACAAVLITAQVARPQDGLTEAPSGRWSTDSAGPVQLISAMPARQAGQALERLQQLRDLLQVFSTDQDREIVILAFDQQRSFLRYAPFEDARGIGGWSQAEGSTSYLGVDRSLRNSWLQTLLHETVHAVLSHRTEPLPLWLEEGVAEFFSTLEDRRSQIAVGLPIERHVRLLRDHQRWLPWESVFAMKTDSPAYGARLDGQLFYAQSWLLIHYLMVDPDRARQLHNLLEDPDGSSLQAADLGLDPQRLQVVLQRWVWSPLLPYLRLPRPQSVEAIERVDLPEAALLAHLGRLLATRSNGTTALARKHFEAALQLDPDQRMALDGIRRLSPTGAGRD